jgi:hypothetical protein
MNVLERLSTNHKDLGVDVTIPFASFIYFSGVAPPASRAIQRRAAGTLASDQLHDHAAGTLVIRLDRPPAAPELATAVNPGSLSLTREQLARIGPREVRLIRGTLRRLETIPEDRRESLLTEVTETLRQHIELAELPSSDRREFLRDLLALTERYSRIEAADAISAESNSRNASRKVTRTLKFMRRIDYRPRDSL